MFSGSPLLTWIRIVGNPGPRNLATSNKMRAKCLGKPLKGVHGTCPQAIKPSHYHRSRTGWEYLTHQGLVLGLDSHSLVEMAHMLHRIRSTIVNGERWLMELPRKLCLFYLARERRLGNRDQRLAHSVISQALVRWAFIPTFVMVLLIVRERLAGWGSRPSSITSILSIVKGNVRVGGASLSLCLVHLLL